MQKILTLSTKKHMSVRKHICVVFFLTLSLSYLCSLSYAAFKDTGWGVRPLGMGGAFTAVADDSNAALFNPAGISRVGRTEATFMSAKLFAGLEGVEIGQNYFGYVHPLGGKYGDMGVTWSSLYTPAVYKEDSIALSYGRYVRKTGELDITVGTNLKYLNHEYTTDRRTVNDPVFALKNSAGNFSFDAGALIMWPEQGFSIGLSGKNINQPDIGLKTEDKVPNENVIGFAYYNEKMKNPDLNYFTLAVDLVSRNKVFDSRVGVESWFFNGAFAVRFGFQSSAASAGLGYEFKLGNETSMVIDYALTWPLQVEKTMGTHRMGITLRLP